MNSDGLVEIAIQVLCDYINDQLEGANVDALEKVILLAQTAYIRKHIDVIDTSTYNGT